MKRLIPAVALAGMFVGTAHAETSVTLYGIADVSVRYLSTGNDNGNSRVSMENGAISNSRWGLRGVEDLGDGMKAFFRLESGFNVQNGERSDPDSFFNRHAYVGLDGGEIGAISLGRQDTPLFTILADSYDPLTVGNYAQNSWLPVAMSRARSSNSVRYRNDKLAGFDVILSYAFSDSFEDHKLGEQYGGTLSYTTGPFSIGGGYMLTHSASNSDYQQRVWNLNASYKFETAKVFIGYFNGRDETGFVNAVMGNTSLPDNGLERKDNGYFAGVTWQATPRWALTGAAYYDTSKNLVEEGDKGKRYALVGVAEYALSKRTQVYGTIDYNKVKDAATGEIQGDDKQIGAAVGIRHIF
ncbi:MULTISPECIES: porin [Bordetella]|uniref:Outer membrane porin protein n=4 Tax=Bordetella TaxID=517 RepID=K0MNQ0_BORPB|nr:MULTISPECIES: porin [Bordetella]KAK67504.1 gram-negative porin [Bordetella bronchiseptica 980-2]SHP61308.1 Outer membrane porin protein BP0840 precursor [Mycobacteroides abscessus subsp. abscessus]AMG90509.1 porin [Bordetella bronchiseptica]AUL17392.1 porin [Bordetella bronchiseptica]AWP60628.1 porin [Bordetella bronchiseptica]